MRLLTAIPVHNEEKYLEDVLRQVSRYAEHILVVDDGSTDRTPAAPCQLPGDPGDPTSTQPRLRGGIAVRLSSIHSKGGYDGLVTLDCDGQHEPVLIPELAAGSATRPTSSREAVTFASSIPSQKPPEERRRINVEVTRWLNECLGLNLTDAFCGFKAYRRSALEVFDITDNGYAMPLQVWVQAVAARADDRRGSRAAHLSRRESGLWRLARRFDVPARTTTGRCSRKPSPGPGLEVAGGCRA